MEGMRRQYNPIVSLLKKTYPLKSYAKYNFRRKTMILIRSSLKEKLGNYLRFQMKKKIRQLYYKN